MPRGEAGQATVEWSALVLVVALALGALGYVGSRVDPVGLGRDIAHAIFCAARGGCPDALEDAYGADLARFVRHYAPNIVYERKSAELPVDFRRCRKVSCSNGPDAPRAVDHSHSGLPVTAFTHVADLRNKGGALFLQYWLYYPESFSGAVGRRLGPLSHLWPGFHEDDWEGYQVRVGPDGTVSARATAHGHYSNLKGSSGWGPLTKWYRVSGGSHAGHLVMRPSNERTTFASALNLVPLERLSGTGAYHFEIDPPWLKGVYREPDVAGS